MNDLPWPVVNREDSLVRSLVRNSRGQETVSRNCIIEELHPASRSWRTLADKKRIDNRSRGFLGAQSQCPIPASAFASDKNLKLSPFSVRNPWRIPTVINGAFESFSPGSGLKNG
jgi:hypothetical protein